MIVNVPARLHVILAREAPRGVVIRRGPSRQVAVIGWDRDKDEFTVGQWLKGRIYERRSDLSPDGRYFIYFAMNGKWSSPVKGSWTAISRAPYLKALALFAKGDCWNGGGLFVSPTSYWLNDGYGHEEIHNSPWLQRSTARPWKDYYGGECPGVYYIRLQRDGWTMIKQHEGPSGDSATVFEKRVTDDWVIRKSAHETLYSPVGKGCYFDTHELVNNRTGQLLDFPTWEWADLDRDRLVWAENGRLFAANVDHTGLVGITELYDFNPLQFQNLRAPY